MSVVSRVVRRGESRLLRPILDRTHCLCQESRRGRLDGVSWDLRPPPRSLPFSNVTVDIWEAPRQYRLGREDAVCEIHHVLASRWDARLISSNPKWSNTTSLQTTRPGLRLLQVLNLHQRALVVPYTSYRRYINLPKLSIPSDPTLTSSQPATHAQLQKSPSSPISPAWASTLSQLQHSRMALLSALTCLPIR